ncbi:hypothetical protein [Streptomyces atratus]|uniref:hypothetical protein n=1 Tax=Streptomyces atratus TaxID=1893 RepID=UPI0033C5E408
MKAHRGDVVAVRQQSLDNGVLQLPVTQRYPVSAGRVCGQAYQDVLRGCWVPPQPGELGVIEACHALNLVGPLRASPPSVLVRKRACGLTELLAREVRDSGREVEVEHLHVHLPRVLKTSASTRTANPEQETAR